MIPSAHALGPAVARALALIAALLGAVAAQAASNDNTVEWAGVGHDTRSTFYRSRYGAFTTGLSLTLKLRVYRFDVTGATVRVWSSAAAEQLYPMSWVSNDATYDYWQATLPAQATPTVLWYRFRVTDGSDTDHYADDASRDGGWGQTYDGEAEAGGNDFNASVYSSAFTTPQWLKDAVIYQVFPDRFFNQDIANDPKAGDKVYGEGALLHGSWSDLPENPPKGRDFFGGDLPGVEAKLDLLHDLGVTALYFNPIFGAPSNHLYDTTDYKAIDAYFGGLADFQTLVTEAGARGMKVILDGVFNHTSVAHPFFQDVVAQGSASPYWSWYSVTTWPIRWFDDIDRDHVWDAGEPQVSWNSPLSGILGSPDYSSWWGFASIPTLTETASVKNYLYATSDSVAKYWLNQGAFGWRLDVADEVSHAFWQGFRPAVKAIGSDRAIIAEAWGDASEYLLGNECDSVMNYRFKFAATDFIAKGTINASTFHNRLLAVQEDYPPPAYYAAMNLLDSHDTARFLWDAGGDKARLRLAALLQMTYAGPPSIYYGGEVGLTGGGDPDSRRTYPWGTEDNALRGDYKRLIAIRKTYAALRTGNVKHGLLVHDTNGSYAFGRDDAARKLVVGLNNSGSARTLNVGVSGYVANGTLMTDLWNGGQYTVSVGTLSVLHPARTGSIAVAKTSSDVSVGFSVNGYMTSFGQNMFVVGNAPELGLWDTSKARPLSWVDSDTWSGTVFFTDYTAGKPIEYKYIVKNADGSVTWEAAANRVFTVPSTGSASRNDTWQY